MSKDLFPGDYSKETREKRKEIRRNLSADKDIFLIEASKIQKEIDELPCESCGYANCPRDCW